MGIEEARKRIAKARRQLERVEGAAFDMDYEGAVIWAFYSYENCVTALAERYGHKWTKNHREKAELASRLHAEGLISRDIGDELQELNRLRKDVAYDEPGPELQERDLEDLAYQLHDFIEETASRIDS